jgi:hypothetical protein
MLAHLKSVFARPSLLVTESPRGRVLRDRRGAQLASTDATIEVAKLTAALEQMDRVAETFGDHSSEF